MTVKLCLVQDPEADELLSTDPFALLTGMLLDQQIPMEQAFAGPKKIAERLARNRVDTSQQIPMEVAFAGPQKLAARMGGLDPHDIAVRDPDEFAALFAEKPAVHRFPGSMAGRVQALAKAVADQYGGDTTALWTVGEPDGAEVLKRLKALPGYGEQKARIFLALLGKQYGVTPSGWREAAGAYGEPGTHLSIADVVDASSLQQVRSTKKAQKLAAKQAQESKGKATT